MSTSTQYYHTYLTRATVGSPSEAVTVNPTKKTWSIKKAFGLPIVTILPRFNDLEVKCSMRSTLTTLFLLLSRSWIASGRGQ